jgi:Tol biopolymer transport system component
MTECRKEAPKARKGTSMLKHLTYTFTAIAALTGVLALAPGTAFGAQVIQLLTRSGATTDASFGAATADGSRVFFETDENIAGTGDTDGLQDVYRAQGGVITLLTGSNPAGSGGADEQFDGISADGSRVFFDTAEDNVGGATDADGANDVYQATGGAITLLSGNGTGIGSFFDDASADGTRVFFHTGENNVGGATDTDGATDVYQATGGAITLVTGTGAGTGSGTGAGFRGASADGTRVFFESGENNVGGATDADGRNDVYQATGGVITLLSGNGAATDAFFDGSSADGTRVFFETAENNVGGATDTDGAPDVYQAQSGAITLLSGNGGALGASFRGASADGTRVFFETADDNVGGPATDTDGANDVYQATGGGITLLSGNGAATDAFFDGISADGSRVFFHTAEDNVGGATDADGANDVYQATGGGITLLSGNGAATDAFFDGRSADGTRVFFDTAENNVGGATDTDGGFDVYQARGGAITLLSGNGAATPASFEAASADGTRVFFDTDENIPGTGDADGAEDVYLSRAVTSSSNPPPVTTPPTTTTTTTPPATATGLRAKALKKCKKKPKGPKRHKCIKKAKKLPV